MRRTYLRDVISQVRVVLRTKFGSDILLVIIISSTWKKNLLVLSSFLRRNVQ